MRGDARAVFGGDRAILGGDREVVSGDLAVARGDGEILCRASEILGGESYSGRVEGAKGRHPRGVSAPLGGFPTGLDGCSTTSAGGRTRAFSQALSARAARGPECGLI